MSRYIINKHKQSSDNGENYEVHNEDLCNHLPLRENRIFLGNFTRCQEAMTEAKRRFPAVAAEIDGCYYCCEACHRE